jgi:hypothetical protein
MRDSRGNHGDLHVREGRKASEIFSKRIASQKPDWMNVLSIDPESMPGTWLQIVIGFSHLILRYRFIEGAVCS